MSRKHDALTGNSQAPDEGQAGLFSSPNSQLHGPRGIGNDAAHRARRAASPEFPTPEGAQRGLPPYRPYSSSPSRPPQTQAVDAAAAEGDWKQHEENVYAFESKQVERKQQLKQLRLQNAELKKDNDNLRKEKEKLRKEKEELEKDIKEEKRKMWELDYNVRDLKQEILSLKETLRNSITIGDEDGFSDMPKSSLERHLEGKIRKLEAELEGLVKDQERLEI
ncbi:hypothetical protein B0T25DRAFT_546978 [Lasiosphaeria hispida]|uniref:Uncharacterized protein n=1 Tax=Lasiosphaeria hispida TaxID=260671 RepID=A0AAJ0HDV8_9PEZI|nr:hypothetical protein B0T25DRAFT_546978 [Lasiosphaeria hispida]